MRNQPISSLNAIDVTKSINVLITEPLNKVTNIRETDQPHTQLNEPINAQLKELTNQSTIISK